MPKLWYLRPKHKRAIEMKWYGSKYKEIASEVGVSIDAVKSWFREKGFLRKAYDSYAEDQSLIWEMKNRERLINTLNGNKRQ